MTYSIAHESGELAWQGDDYDKALQAAIDMEIVDDRSWKITYTLTGEEVR